MKRPDFIDGDLSQANRIGATDFLNPVLDAVWDAIGDGVNAPTTPIQVVANLGLTSYTLELLLSKLKVGNANLFGYPDTAYAQVYVNTGAAAPTGLIPAFRSVIAGKGDNTTAIGVEAAYLEARDRTDVTDANKGVLYTAFLAITPIVARNNSPYDDATVLAIQNTTGVAGAAATDVEFVGHNSFAFAGTTPEFQVWQNSDANFIVAYRFSGSCTSYFMDLFDAAIGATGAIRLPNNKGIVARDAGNVSDRDLIKLDTSDGAIVGTGCARVESAAPHVFGSQTVYPLPVAISASTYLVAAAVTYMINQFAGGSCTITLPSAASSPGRRLVINTEVAQTTISASANVIPLGGGAAGTAILSANAGRWCEMVSNGTNWKIMTGVI